MCIRDRKGIARSFDELEPAGAKWHRFKWPALAGNYLLMMFYTTVAGWMIVFMLFRGTGTFEGLDARGVEGVYNTMPVSYTHLDVYKRQTWNWPHLTFCAERPDRPPSPARQYPMSIIAGRCSETGSVAKHCAGA